MRHFLISGTQIRVGVVAGFFCYQPFVAGRLGKAVQLFPDWGDCEANALYFEANFEPQVKENGDIMVVPCLKSFKWYEEQDPEWTIPKQLKG